MSTPRYIDAEKLKQDLVSYAGIPSIINVFIDRQVTADVEPVIHAHWIIHERAEEVEGRLISNYECSHCHEWFRDNRRRCGECGAKMDEKN